MNQIILTYFTATFFIYERRIVKLFNGNFYFHVCLL